MEIDPSRDQSTKPKVEELRSLTIGPLQSSIAKVSGSSRGMPSDKDFHFYYNFDEFKVPVKEIEKQSNSMLETIGKSSHLLGKEMTFPSRDLDDAYDWLVNVNDEVLERFDASVDEFRSLRKREEETGVRLMSLADSEDGFQVVYGKKSKKGVGLSRVLEEIEAKRKESSPLSGVKVASRAGTSKPKVPFHIPTIPRPQDAYKIVVNNSNQPFTHVWLPKCEDGSRFIHPLENFSILDFVDKDIPHAEPEKPPPIESTPFKLVEEVKDLKELAAKLRDANEFAVDLEHNQYRSFQGLTCLMQVSTRTEDYVVDTLKLRIHIGPYLREVFKDPAKKKVMHGADRDILWLQRDFGIYVCNLFDTGQASRVLKMERNSLEYLLSHFCGIMANKEYQNADWRLRPLPHEMLRYAREDTHYLLYIYDVMRQRLLSSSAEAENSDILSEVYKRSYDICIQLYEKELLTDSSYLYIYGLQGVDFSAQQLAVVSGLCEWRDVVARAEDESTGYILPNKTLIEIAKQMPLTANKLRRLVRSKHPYVERNLGSVVSIIRHSIQNASAFEAAVEQLKERRETAAEENPLGAGRSKAPLPVGAPASVEPTRGEECIAGSNSTANCSFGQAPSSVWSSEMDLGGSKTAVGRKQGVGCSKHPGENGHIKSEAGGHMSPLPRKSTTSGQMNVTDSGISLSLSASGATVQVSNKPSSAFGALLGSAKRKHHDKKEKEEIKLEQIKSSVNLPFHSFLAREEQLELAGGEPSRLVEISDDEEPVAMPATGSNLEDVILLDTESDVEEESPSGDQPTTNEDVDSRQDNDPGILGADEENENMSLSDLSSSFQKCFQSSKETRQVKQGQKSQECEGLKKFKPFDYEAARKHVKFGEDSMVVSGALGHEDPRSRVGLGDKKRGSLVGLSQKDEGTKDHLPGRRRQAFPASGNRSATFL